METARDAVTSGDAMATPASLAPTSWRSPPVREARPHATGHDVTRATRSLQAKYAAMNCTPDSSGALC